MLESAQIEGAGVIEVLLTGVGTARPRRRGVCAAGVRRHGGRRRARPDAR
ncbi:hypothetical protein [Streptomyces malaysiensis]|nr:hypothetical protein R8789_44260 [Streptomyces malaysiensis]